MKGKIFLYITLSIIIVIGAFFIAKGFAEKESKEITEYIPEEEISEEQERQTLVSLFFQNKESKTIIPEARLIDAKLLIINPYETLINLLLDGPKNEKLQSIIPKSTKLLNAKLEGNTITVNFSEELNNVKDEENKEKMLKSIEKTLKELNEIEKVKILVNGVEFK